MLACHQGTVQDSAGNAIPDCVIQVLNEQGGALAVLFEDVDGTIGLSNSFNSDAVTGKFIFFVESGFYRVTATKDAVQVADDRWVAIGTGAGVALGAQFLPRGLWSAVVTYSLNDLTRYGGTYGDYLFVSLQNTNLNHAPDATTPTDTAWWMLVGIATRFEMGIGITGTAPSDGEIIEGHVFAQPMSFPLNFAGSRATCRDTATASAVFHILKNGVSVGTLTFAAGAPTGTFSAAAFTVAAGDQLDLQCPSPADVTIRGIKVTLRGSP